MRKPGTTSRTPHNTNVGSAASHVITEPPCLTLFPKRRLAREKGCTRRLVRRRHCIGPAARAVLDPAAGANRQTGVRGGRAPPVHNAEAEGFEPPDGCPSPAFKA